MAKESRRVLGSASTVSWYDAEAAANASDSSIEAVIVVVPVQILKTVIPYMDGSRQRTFALMVKFLELRNVASLFNAQPVSLRRGSSCGFHEFHLPSSYSPASSARARTLVLMGSLWLARRRASRATSYGI